MGTWRDTIVSDTLKLGQLEGWKLEVGLTTEVGLF